MTSTNVIIVILHTMIVFGCIGYFLGKYHERLKWNKLIEDGIIPKPKNQKKQ